MDIGRLERGKQLLNRAVEADNNKEFSAALALYIQGAEYLLAGTTSFNSRSAIETRIEQYVERAEEIKVMLRPAKLPYEYTKEEKTEPVVDRETSQLQAALSSTFMKTKPNVKWSDVAGLNEAKAILKEAVLLPRKFPQLFTGKRTPWKAVLLYGPPGTGKSYLAKAVATEGNAACFLSVSSSDLVSKYQGESERLVKQLFELARGNRPAVIFIDEVDSLCGARGQGENESSLRIKTEILVQMEGVNNDNKDILVLGATNTPWQLDIAIRRRFEKRVYIPLPDAAARRDLIKQCLGSTPHNLTNENIIELANKAEGFSGADISIAVRDALYEPIRLCQLATHFKKVTAEWFQPCSCGDADAVEMSLEDVPEGRLQAPDIQRRHVEDAIHKTKPSVGVEDIEKFTQWTLDYGQNGAE